MPPKGQYNAEDGYSEFKMVFIAHIRPVIYA